MNWDEVRQELTETGRYETHDVPRTVCDRFFGQFDTWLHWLILRMVWRARLKVLVGRYDLNEYGYSAFAMMRAVERCGGKVIIEGVKHSIDLDGPAVYVANHMSMLETITVPMLLAPLRPFYTVVKANLLRYPWMGPVLRRSGTIPVSRTNPREDLKIVLKEGSKALSHGASVLLFPQATRNPVFLPETFGSLGTKLARRAGVPVVPLAVKTDFLGLGRIIPDFGPVDRSKVVRMCFGKPIYAEGTGREAHQQSVDFIVGKLREWGGTVET